MKIIGIIPARYASSRFPGKPLAMIGGKSMINRVYEQVKKCEQLSDVYVATDNQTIYNHVVNFGGKAVMTGTEHLSGTDRCFEALQIIEKENDTTFDITVNIQGDEPFINPNQINQVVSLFQNSDTDIATLIKKIDEDEEVNNTNVVKVVTSNTGKALYFSRAAIPFQRDKENAEKPTYYKHIGMYAYKNNVLEKLVKLKPSMLELSESLEQLRWLENGHTIYTAVTDYENKGIDTYEDLLAVLKKL